MTYLSFVLIVFTRKFQTDQWALEFLFCFDFKLRIWREFFEHFFLQFQAHSLSSRGKNRARSSASSSSSSTLTASSSDVSIKRFVNNKDSLNNNNNQDTVSEVQLHTTDTDIISHPGLYKEPRLNKSDSASLSQHQWLNSRHGSHVPLSPNSIDNRYTCQEPIYFAKWFYVPFLSDCVPFKSVSVTTSWTTEIRTRMISWPVLVMVKPWEIL